jgi:hypothetical protein
MGTAGSYGGSAPGNILTPSFVSNDDIPVAGTTPEGGPEPPPQGAAKGELERIPVAAPPPPAAAIPVDFGNARRSFTSFARSGGHNRRALGRAMSSYVSAANGGRHAARHMGASRAAGAALAGFLADVARHGVTEALRTLNLSALAGRPPAEMFAALIDVFCPEGGTIDEAIAREAFVEMIIELTEIGVADVADLAPDRMPEIFELFVAHAIEARIENDIAMKAVALPTNTAAAQRVQDVLCDFVRRAVHDVVAQAADFRQLAEDRIKGWVDTVYAQAFELLRVLGESEAR